MVMRAPIRMQGVPRPRPVASPVHIGGDPMQLIPILQEMQRIAKFIEAWGPKIIAAGDKLDTIKEGRPGLPGKSVVLDEVVDALKAQLPLPELHDLMLEQLAPKVAKHISVPKRGKRGEPGQSATAPDAATIVDEFFRMLTTGEKQLSLEHVKGLEALITNKLAEVRSQVATQGGTYGKDTWARGGGDTVEAGTGVTITNTPNGRKKINAISSIGSWQTPPESPNGVLTVFTVGGSAPTDVVADGTAYFNGAGYTYAAGHITFDNPPAQYVRYR